jgi:hypothetical protein
MTQKTINESYAAIDAGTGATVGTRLPLGPNLFSGSSPNYRDTLASRRLAWRSS